MFEDKEILLKLILNDCIYFSEIDDLEWAKEEEILKILHNNGNFFTKLSNKQKEDFLFIKAATLESKICCEEFFDIFFISSYQIFPSMYFLIVFMYSFVDF